MNPTLKRYLVSSLITFLSVFLLALATSIGSLDVETFNSSILLGIVVVAGRAALKAVSEYLLSLIK
jgi:hypothetical protein